MPGQTLDLGNLLVHLRMDASQYLAMLKTAEAKMKFTAQRMTQIGTQLSLRVTVPLVAMGTASTKAFANFDDAMTKSLAIMSGITPVIRQEMESLALTMSEQSVTSAKDLAKSYFFLASAGLDAAQSMAALGAVNQFAIAGAFDMATATDLATDAQSALGLTVKDAQQNLVNMTRVTDVLVGANTLANATTEQFSLALTSQAGPAMKAYGIELEEGVAVLAAFADQGIKAQNAGNLFSRMLRLMTKGFMDNRTAWKRLNINIFDSTGALKPMSNIVGDLSNALGAMSTRQKIATLDMLGFQARSQQAILPLLGMGDAIAKYKIQLEDMGGITREVSEKQMKSFSSQMKILKNQIVAVGIEIGTILAPHITKLNEKIKKLIISWKELDKITKEWVIGIAAAAAIIGPALIVIGALIKLVLFMKGAVIAVAAAWTFLLNAFMQFVVFHPIVALFVILIARITQLAFRYNKLRAEFIRLNGKLIESNELLKKHKKIWDEIATTLEQTFKGRIITRQIEVIQKQLKQKLDELKLLKEDFDKLNFVDKWIQAPARKSIINRLTLEIAQLERVLESLSTRGEAEAGRIETEFVGPPLPEGFGEKPEGLFDTEAFDKKLQEWVDGAKNVSENIADAFTSGLDRLSQGITDMLWQGEVDFRAILDSIAKEVVNQLIRSQVAAMTGAAFGLGEAAADGGQDTANALMEQEAALVNESAALTNQAAAITGQGTSLVNQANSLMDQATGLVVQAASAINQTAGGTMTTAAGIMEAAAAQMIIAANINAGASVAGGVGHGGGMVGSISNTRVVPASTFVGAPRFHQGLADDEFAMIAQRGEVILSKDNVAELKRGAGEESGGGTVVNNFHMSAIDGRSLAKLFKDMRRQIASGQQVASRENNAIRRNR